VKRRSCKIIAIASLLLVLAFLGYRWRMARIEFSQDHRIVAAARKHRVDPALVKAVVWRESRFDPAALGTKGERGLMQIMERTGGEWASATREPMFSTATLLDPERNIDCGSWYLAKLLRRYQKTDDPVPYALADYNAGRSNVLKWMKGSAATNSATFIGQIGFPSTRHYVRTVVERRAKYAGQFPDFERGSQSSVK
jgi:soluble lytic murein transglycosylase